MEFFVRLILSGVSLGLTIAAGLLIQCVQSVGIWWIAVPVTIVFGFVWIICMIGTFMFWFVEAKK